MKTSNKNLKTVQLTEKVTRMYLIILIILLCEKKENKFARWITECRKHERGVTKRETAGCETIFLHVKIHVFI